MCPGPRATLSACHSLICSLVSLGSTRETCRYAFEMWCHKAVSCHCAGVNEADAGLSASTVSFVPIGKLLAFQMEIDSCYLAQLPDSSAPQECSLHAHEISNLGSRVILRYDVISGEASTRYVRGSSLCHSRCAQSPLIGLLQRATRQVAHAKGGAHSLI